MPEECGRSVKIMVLAMLKALLDGAEGDQPPTPYKQKPFFSRPQPEPIEEFEVEAQSLLPLADPMDAKRFLSHVMPLCG